VRSISDKQQPSIVRNVCQDEVKAGTNMILVEEQQLREMLRNLLVFDVKPRYGTPRITALMYQQKCTMDGRAKAISQFSAIDLLQIPA
jgi:hypothetical protein